MIERKIKGEGLLVDDDVVHINTEDAESIDASEYYEDLTEYFTDMPDVVCPLVKGAKEAFSKIEQMLYTTPAFINMVRASIPEQAFQAILTGDQKASKSYAELLVFRQLCSHTKP